MTRQEHILTIIAEESVEIAKNATKALRFGLDDCEPGIMDSADNAHRMLCELADLLAAFEMLTDNDPYFAKVYENITERRRELMDAKIAKVEKYLQYSKEHGRLI